MAMSNSRSVPSHASLSTYQSPGDTGVILVRGCVPEAAQSSSNTATLIFTSTAHPRSK